MGETPSYPQLDINQQPCFAIYAACHSVMMRKGLTMFLGLSRSTPKRPSG